MSAIHTAALRKAQMRATRDHLKWERQFFGKEFVPIPRDRWPAEPFSGTARIGVHRNKDFLVQTFALPEGMLRLSVNRTAWDGHNWRDGITWEDLQRIKDAIGYEHRTAVEVYPPKHLIVNKANMRHLVLLTETPLYVWGSDIK